MTDKQHHSERPTSASLHQIVVANKGKFLGLILGTVVIIAVIGLFTINLSPLQAFGGVVWLKHGVHYLNNEQISARITELNAPLEAKLAEEISSSTPSCDTQEQGYCERSPGDYFYKTLVTPAVEYKAGTPDTRVVTGYCTLCNDGTFSPSCAVGRGACSYHSGVASYNVAEYRTIPGTSAVQAQAAVYSYESKTYKDSALYVSPEKPKLTTVVGF